MLIRLSFSEPRASYCFWYGWTPVDKMSLVSKLTGIFPRGLFYFVDTHFWQT